MNPGENSNNPVALNPTTSPRREGAPTTTGPSCPSWCAASGAEHDDWDRESDGHLHRTHVAELGDVAVAGTPYSNATVAVSLVADDVIEFSVDAVTLHRAGVPAIDLQGPDGRVGLLTRFQARALADLLTTAAAMVEEVLGESVPLDGGQR